MDLDLLAVLLSMVGIGVPVFAFFWEFVVVRRKRFGYRVQMDTSAIDEIGSGHAGVLERMRLESGTPLVDPSFVLIRIENDGATTIDEDDYKVIKDVKAGARILFPGRKVAGMVITELSDPVLSSSFSADSGLGSSVLNGPGQVTGVIDLPRVPLNRGDHYKVLAILERAGQPQDPRVEVGIKNGQVKVTKAQTGVPRRASVLIAFMTVVIVGLGSFVWFRENSPLDCAAGTLTLTGSTAFEPVMREAAQSYEDTCSSAHFEFDFKGSSDGLQALEAAGKQAGGTPAMVAFSDGPKGETQPLLLPQPVAFLLFTLVVNRDAGVDDLSLDQVRQLYDGKIANWQQIGGNDVPVTLVSRRPGSGTRTTFQRQILEGRREPATNSDNCRTRDSGGDPGVIRCERDRTDDLLDTVAATSGALGYAELRAATDRGQDLVTVQIAGQRAALDAAVEGAYPFWETEFGYTYQQPEADSLAASFLRYLTDQVGKDIIRAHGNRPCDELQNPALCRPGG